MTGWPTKAEPGVWLKFNLVPQKNFNFPGNIEYSIMMKILHFSEQNHPRLPFAEIYQHYSLQSTTHTTELEENAWIWGQTYIVAIFHTWYKLFIGVHQYKPYAYGINSIITIAIVSSIYNFFHVWMSWVTKSLNLASHKIILLSEINPSQIVNANKYLWWKSLAMNYRISLSDQLYPCATANKQQISSHYQSRDPAPQ